MGEDKVQVILTDEAGKEVPFYTKTLTEEFKGKPKGKKYKVAIEQPSLTRINVGEYTIQGGTTPPPPVDNKPPVVHAGEDQAVKPGATVTLVASDSDEDGIVSVEDWRQEQGALVKFVYPDPANKKIVTFVAPSAAAELVFAFSATDDKGAVVIDKMRVAVGTVIPPPPPPPPGGDLLFDSNTDIDWPAIQAALKPGETFLKVTESYGNIKGNGKGFHMEASGNPRMLLYPATKELCLEHDGEYGRAYVAVCNYQARLEAEFKLTNANDNASFKTRCRHQFREFNKGASDKQTQGGQGTSFAVDSVDADLEIVHGGNPQEMSGPTKSLSPKLEINKYYPMKFSQFDKNGKIHIIDELNGKVVNEGDVAAPAQFFNRAEFETWSEFWLRGNMPKGGKMWFKNIRMYKL
jgi:hypothetical protein